MSSQTDLSITRTAPAFASIVCGVDGSGPSLEAARQAMQLSPEALACVTAGDDAVLHRSPAPVLVARRPPDGVEFPQRILLASDGTPMSDRAVRLAARIAARHGSHVAIAAVRDGEAPFRPGLAEHATQIREATGREPVIFDLPGPPHRAVAHAALDFEAALVVTGASERIAHVAPCSVLVARY